jgi:membrane protein implicated in regulation of membrane protease activity
MKQSHNLRPALAALALSAALALTSGCFLLAVGAAGAAGAGSVAYVRGQLDASLAKPYDAVVNAADASVGQLQLAKIRESRDFYTSVIEARTADDKKVVIKINKQADNLSRVRIRIGFFGDEGKSRGILERIQADL